MVAKALSLPYLTSGVTFDLNEGHYHIKLASVVVTKFGSHRAMFNIFTLVVPSDPLSIYSFCSHLPYTG